MARISSLLYALGLALVASVALADDIKSKVTAVDLDKRTINVTVDDKDQSFDVSPSAKVYRLTGNNVKRSGYAELPGGLKEVSADAMVTLTRRQRRRADTSAATFPARSPRSTSRSA